MLTCHSHSPTVCSAHRVESTSSSGGIARLVAKILWLDAENPDLQSEIQGGPAMRPAWRGSWKQEVIRGVSCIWNDIKWICIYILYLYTDWTYVGQDNGSMSSTDSWILVDTSGRIIKATIRRSFERRDGRRKDNFDGWDPRVTTVVSMVSILKLSNDFTI